MSAFHDPALVKKYGRWLILLGVLNIILGFAALVFVGFTTLVSIKLLGFIFIFSGASEIALGIQTRKEPNGSLSLHLLLGILSIVVGFFILRDPLVNAVGLTLFIALLLWVSGTFRMVDAILDRRAGWGRVFFSGLISVILGTLIFRQWPESAFWALGVFVGVDVLSYGMMLLSLGLVSKKISA